jgi:hypothetical protein
MGPHLIHSKAFYASAVRMVSLSMLFIVALIDITPARLYSRALREKWVADSLKRIDSVRIADSLHVADSLTVARYEKSDNLLAEEKRQELAEIKVIPKICDTGTIQISAPIDNMSGRTIVVDPKNPYAKAIDSLQKTIDSLNNALHDNDVRFKDMKSFPISEKKRYISFLLTNKMKDTTAILAYCNSLANIYKVKHELLLAIKNSQDMNTKSFLQHHIEEHKGKMTDLNNYILALTPKLPYFPERGTQKKITEQ